MKILDYILNALAIACCIVLLYFFYPSIADNFRNKNINNIDNTEEIKNNKNKSSNLDDLKGIGSLAKDSEVSKSLGYTGEEYSFDTTYYPYYGILDDKYKDLYKQVYANAINLNQEFTPTIDISKDEVTPIIEAVMYDHPELFYLDNSYSFKYNNKGKCLQINLKFNDLADDYENTKNLFDSKVEEIVSLASIYSSDIDKEKFVHDKLVNMLNYNNNAKYNQSAYSALINRDSVCAGYSRAFQYIMIKLDIPCYYVTGDSNGDHAWNIVQIDDSYYNVDITWDNTGNNKYGYFNKNDDDFSATHTRSEISNKLPTCSSDSYSINPYISGRVKKNKYGEYENIEKYDIEVPIN